MQLFRYYIILRCIRGSLQEISKNFRFQFFPCGLRAQQLCIPWLCHSKWNLLNWFKNRLNSEMGVSKWEVRDGKFASELFRGSVRGMFRGYISGVCFAKIELFPALLEVGHPKKNTNPNVLPTGGHKNWVWLWKTASPSFKIFNFTPAKLNRKCVRSFQTPFVSCYFFAVPLLDIVNVQATDFLWAHSGCRTLGQKSLCGSLPTWLVRAWPQQLWDAKDSTSKMLRDMSYTETLYSFLLPSFSPLVLSMSPFEISFFFGDGMHFRYKSILHLPPYHWARLQASRLTCQIGQPIADAFPLQDVGPLDASFQKRFFTWKQPQGMQPSWLRKKNSKLELTGFVTQHVKKHAIYLEIHCNSSEPIGYSR